MSLNFKPLAKKYNFKNEVLYMDMPNHMQKATIRWMHDVLKDARRLETSTYTNRGEYITTGFMESLEVHLRETYPQYWNDFVDFVFGDLDRELTLLQWCLNYFADEREANSLEWILSNGGSGYSVLKLNKDQSEYTDGGYDLVERVPEVVKKASEEAISSNEKLMAAWVACYGKNPNYKEVVQQTQNVMEELLRDTYLPKDTKAQLGKLIGDIKAGKKLTFKGSALLSDSNVMLDLINKFPEYRGIHTGGTGKTPNKEIAEYALHTAIYLWGLHQS